MQKQLANTKYNGKPSIHYINKFFLISFSNNFFSRAARQLLNFYFCLVAGVNNMNASDDHYIIKKTDDLIEACYYVEKDEGDPFWRDHSSLNTALPFLLTQLFVVLFVDRLLLLIVKYLRQPPIVAHILVRIILIKSS